VTVVATKTSEPYSGDGCLPAYAALLWISLILMLIGGLVSIVRCILANWFPQAGLIVGIVGVAIFALGAFLLPHRWTVCRFLTACAAIQGQGGGIAAAL
jgi:hypothetical protein